MISKETDYRLMLLMNIEKSIAGIYGSFAVTDSYGDRVRRFWATMMEAELEHAALFRNIRDRARHDDTVHVEVDITGDQLRETYARIRHQEKRIIEGEISEMKAFSLGASIEEGLFEFSYARRVKSNNPEVMNMIGKVEEDTRQHYLLLHNYALEGKGPP